MRESASSLSLLHSLAPPEGPFQFDPVIKECNEGASFLPLNTAAPEKPLWVPPMRRMGTRGAGRKRIEQCAESGTLPASRSLDFPGRFLWCRVDSVGRGQLGKQGIG